MPEGKPVVAPARPYIGGQALLEGVMMRSPHSFSIVCRRRSGELVVRERPVIDERKGFRALPLVRGVVTLVESLRLGSEALKYSAGLFEADLEEEEREEARRKSVGAGITSTLAALSLPIIALATGSDDRAGMPGPVPEPSAKKEGGGSQVMMIAFALTLFVALPQGVANLINRVFHLGLDIRDPMFQLITGAMKLCIVVGYLSLIRRIPEIRRVFQYHGAEHKSISTYEAEEALEVGNARTKTTLHPRCGTTFLVMVAMVSVVMFSLLGTLLPPIHVTDGWMNTVVENVALFAMKIPFLPVLAAVTFEIQRVFARYCTTGPLRVLLWPGFLVQKITTIEPDDDQLEVALASLRATLARETNPAVASEGVTEASFPSYEAFSDGWGHTPVAAAAE